MILSPLMKNNEFKGNFSNIVLLLKMFQQLWSSIPPNINKTIASHLKLNSLNTKKKRQVTFEIQVFYCVKI